MLITRVDAFTDRPFSGNPAAVCVLGAPIDAERMQQIAGEMNLSETAFLHPIEVGFNLRWFTPRVEVDLCGHATLAAAHVLWEQNHLPEDQPARFFTRSGWLVAERAGDLIEMDFPATPAEPIAPPAELVKALRAEPVLVAQSQFDYLVELADAAALRRLQPDFGRLKQLDIRGVIATSRPEPPSAADFLSRFFAPAAGVDEDPVTGSAHCCLGPFWSARLGRDALIGHQVSSRGGTVHVEVRGPRVRLGGKAVTVGSQRIRTSAKDYSPCAPGASRPGA
jgi:PhzF family phenazine biosynthesis protein